MYDTMQFIKPDVATLCLGQASSMGAFLMAGGAKGKRYALPNARFMIHQPLGAGIQGQVTDIQIHAREIQLIKVGPPLRAQRPPHLLLALAHTPALISWIRPRFCTCTVFQWLM